MVKPSFAEDLQRYGPHAQPERPPTLRQSRRYCRRLARQHYENFTVVSRLFPRALRQHICNIYAYCRWADDLADEVADPRQSLALLAWWEKHLRMCYQGQAIHPVFIALGDTIRKFNIPDDPFVDLLVAFRQDQQVHRYETHGQLLEYCRYSANPVGRLMLYLCQCHTPERTRLSDWICTGLQLANFCQDVAVDWQRGRVYFPQVECRRFGYDESMFAGRVYNEAFRRLMAVQVEQAEALLRRGLPLVNMLPSDMRLPVAVFVFGGLKILDLIKQHNYDVWNARPQLSTTDKLRILATCWWQLRRGTLLVGTEP